MHAIKLGKLIAPLTRLVFNGIVDAEIFSVDDELGIGRADAASYELESVVFGLDLERPLHVERGVRVGSSDAHHGVRVYLVGVGDLLPRVARARLFVVVVVVSEDVGQLRRSVEGAHELEPVLELHVRDIGDTRVRESRVGSRLFVGVARVRTGVQNRFRNFVRLTFAELQAAVDVADLHVVADPNGVVAHVQISDLEFGGPDVVRVVRVGENVAPYGRLSGHGERARQVDVGGGRVGRESGRAAHGEGVVDDDGGSFQPRLAGDGKGSVESNFVCINFFQMKYTCRHIYFYLFVD